MPNFAGFGRPDAALWALVSARMSRPFSAVVRAEELLSTIGWTETRNCSRLRSKVGEQHQRSSWGFVSFRKEGPPQVRMCREGGPKHYR